MSWFPGKYLIRFIESLNGHSLQTIPAELDIRDIALNIMSEHQQVHVLLVCVFKSSRVMSSPIYNCSFKAVLA